MEADDTDALIAGLLEMPEFHEDLSILAPENDAADTNDADGRPSTPEEILKPIRRRPGPYAHRFDTRITSWEQFRPSELRAHMVRQPCILPLRPAAQRSDGPFTWESPAPPQQYFLLYN